MVDQTLIDIVKLLTPQEQDAVLAFIQYLKQRDSSGESSFVQAADQFIAEHPELLARLAQ